jgi:8-oxo-dGTP diphosphatase
VTRVSELATISVAVYVRSLDKRLLFVQKRKSGLWGPPAGRQKVGEGIFDAAVRETKEESGMIVRLLDIIGMNDVIEEDQLRLGIAFRAEMVGGELGPEDPEIEKAAFLKDMEIDRIILKGGIYKPKHTLLILEDERAGRTYPLDIIRKVVP